MAEREPIGIVIAQIKQLQGRLIQRFIKESAVLVGYQLNSGQINLMYQLWMEDDISISQLSDRTQLANTTLTTMLDRLEAQGMVERIVNVSNRREIRIRLTQKGKGPKVDSREIIKHMRMVNFKGFTEEEIEDVELYLNRMKRNLETFTKERDV